MQYEVMSLLTEIMILAERGDVDLSDDDVDAMVVIAEEFADESFQRINVPRIKELKQ